MIRGKPIFPMMNMFLNTKSGSDMAAAANGLASSEQSGLKSSARGSVALTQELTQA